MIVKNKRYPEIAVELDGHEYFFKDGKCEIPNAVALKLTQMGGDYEIDLKSVPLKLYPDFNPNTWTKDYKKIIWDGPVGYNNGYGKASMMFMEGLETLADVKIINSKWIGSNGAFVSDNLEKIIKKEVGEIDSYYIRFFPASVVDNRVAERQIIYTMLECSRIPKSWVDICNNLSERIIVPCTHQKQAFIDSGVKRDIEVVPLGIVSEMFPYIEREIDDFYFFGTMGTLTYRKGTDILVKAFMEGLPKDKYPDARLYIKTLPLGGIGSAWFIDQKKMNDDGRIILNVESLSPDQLIKEFFAKIDCFVFPTRGEGFGLPPLEAIATGLPTICTSYSGTGDFMNDKTGYPLDYKLVDVPNGTLGGYPPELSAPGQQWAEPDYDQLVEHMRYCYSHREEAKKKAKRSSGIIKREYDIKECSQKLINYLDRKF